MSLDAVVVGLGATGSSALYQLARRGARVAGIDRFSPPHTLGSSHGETRITRQAIGEGEAYTPLALRSHQIWREIEALTGEELMVETGGLWISSAARRATTHGTNFFERTIDIAQRFAIPHEVLDAAAIRRRFPQFEVRDNEAGYYEPGAGYLRPEACIAAQLRLAERHGAAIHRGETVVALEDGGDGVEVVTDRGRYRARTAILAAGPWLLPFLPPGHARRFRVLRQTLFWFALDAPLEQFAAPTFPVWIWELQDRPNVIYGFPAIDGQAGGVKVATEQYESSTSPETVVREVSDAEKRAMHGDLVLGHLRGVGERCIKSAACLYTLTPDFHFVIDRHPMHANVIVASPCSGHGFKHSPALGEALADMAEGKTPAIDTNAFRFARFG